jgi:hypothetical protein|nr:MAG TPA: hypothetical protein [Crassvirales sp.]
MTAILVVYIIGAIIYPIYMAMLWKHKRWNFSVGDLLFGIMTCWFSWVGILFLFIEFMSDKTLFRFHDKG